MKRISFNPYDILNIREHATIEQIKEARRELIKKTPHETHPEEARRINEAYQMLKDKVKRSEVDRFLNSKPGALLEIQKHFKSEEIKKILFESKNVDFDQNFLKLPNEIELEKKFLINLLETYMDLKYDHK